MKIIKWLGLIVIAGIILLFIAGIPQDIYKYITLQTFYSELTTAQMNDDYETLYALTTPEQKRELSYNDFVNEIRRTEKPFHEEFIINSYEVIGDKGIVDRTYIVCYTDCEGENRTETRLRKEYMYIGGKWYAPQDNTLVCGRTEPYPIPEEFSRAVSLIIQRLENSNYGQAGTKFSEEDKAFAKVLKKMKPCLNIQYAQTNEEMSGAEGIFMFERGNNTDELLIHVSPDFSLRDDLATAILLRHELHHAYLHATGIEQVTSCLENEAQAFAVQNGFYDALNPEEQKSLVARYSTSPNIKDYFDTREVILANPGNFGNEKAMKYVQGSEFYQNQCSESTN